MSKNLTTLILKQNYPVLEYFLETVANGENLDVEELKKKYLSPLKEYKKKRSRAKGVVNGYSVFLADKDVDAQIKKENPESEFGVRSKIKGKMWRELPNNEKEKYRKKAKEMNSKKCNDDEEEKSED